MRPSQQGRPRPSGKDKFSLFLPIFSVPKAVVEPSFPWLSLCFGRHSTMFSPRLVGASPSTSQNALAKAQPPPFTAFNCFCRFSSFGSRPLLPRRHQGADPTDWILTMQYKPTFLNVLLWRWSKKRTRQYFSSCLPSGFVQYKDGFDVDNHIRAPCTDPTWQSPYRPNAFNSCPVVCFPLFLDYLRVNLLTSCCDFTEQRHCDAPVTPCGDASSDVYCCRPNNSTCCNTSKAVTLVAVTVLTARL